MRRSFALLIDGISLGSQVAVQALEMGFDALLVLVQKAEDIVVDGMCKAIVHLCHRSSIIAKLVADRCN